jgi:predicted enzyme related to lactoylglutathione lyase
MITPKRSLRVLAAPVLLMASACVPASVSLPSISPEPAGPHLPGKVVWRDLLTTDLPAAQRFYGDLFGWRFTDGGTEGYVVATLDGRRVAGLASADEVEGGVNVSQWISSVSSADVDEDTNRAAALGATIHRTPRDVGERGRLAVLSDPQGALFALVRTPAGDPLDDEPTLNEWLWTELWTRDVEAASRFYGEVLGYRRTTLENEVLSRGYVAFERDGNPRAGVIEYQVEGVRPSWLPYVRVADARATARRAEELGGRVLIPPSDDLRDGTVALIADPSGGAVAVQEWTPSEGGDR